MKFDKLLYDLSALFGGIMQREILSYAKTNDIPLTAVHMANVDDYGFFTKEKANGCQEA
jgi:hypothetical protein